MRIAAKYIKQKMMHKYPNFALICLYFFYEKDVYLHKVFSPVIVESYEKCFKIRNFRRKIPNDSFFNIMHDISLCYTNVKFAMDKCNEDTYTVLLDISYIGILYDVYVYPNKTFIPSSNISQLTDFQYLTEINHWLRTELYYNRMINEARTDNKPRLKDFSITFLDSKYIYPVEFSIYTIVSSENRSKTFFAYPNIYWASAKFAGCVLRILNCHSWPRFTKVHIQDYMGHLIKL